MVRRNASDEGITQAEFFSIISRSIGPYVRFYKGKYWYKVISAMSGTFTWVELPISYLRGLAIYNSYYGELPEGDE